MKKIYNLSILTLLSAHNLFAADASGSAAAAAAAAAVAKATAQAIAKETDQLKYGEEANDLVCWRVVLNSQAGDNTHSAFPIILPKNALLKDAHQAIALKHNDLGSFSLFAIKFVTDNSDNETTYRPVDRAYIEFEEGPLTSLAAASPFDGLQIVTSSDNKLYKAKLAATAKK